MNNSLPTAQCLRSAREYTGRRVSVDRNQNIVRRARLSSSSSSGTGVSARPAGCNRQMRSILRRTGGGYEYSYLEILSQQVGYWMIFYGMLELLLGSVIQT